MTLISQHTYSTSGLQRRMQKKMFSDLHGGSLKGSPSSEEQTSISAVIRLRVWVWASRPEARPHVCRVLRMWLLQVILPDL